VEPWRAALVLGCGTLVVGVAVRSLAHAVEGYHLARDGLTERLGAVVGTMWLLTLVALGGVAAVLGGWLHLLWQVAVAAATGAAPTSTSG
jgi:hypothetical protein